MIRVKVRVTGGGLKIAQSFECARPLQGAPGAKIAPFSTKAGSLKPRRNYIFFRFFFGSEFFFVGWAPEFLQVSSKEDNCCEPAVHIPKRPRHHIAVPWFGCQEQEIGEPCGAPRFQRFWNQHASASAAKCQTLPVIAAPLFKVGGLGGGETLQTGWWDCGGGGGG